MQVKRLRRGRVKRAVHRRVTRVTAIGLVCGLGVVAGTVAGLVAPARIATQPRPATHTASFRVLGYREAEPQLKANWVGSSVALAGRIAIVGTSTVGYGAGAADVYIYTAGDWRKLATVSDPRQAPGDYFGAAVAASVVGPVTYLAVGVADGNVAYIYTESNGAVRREQTIQDPGSSVLDGFGSALAISGRTLVIGASQANDATGLAYIYSLSGSRWVMRDRCHGWGSGNPQSFFGISMAISKQLVVIGSTDAAYIYVQSPGGTWSGGKKISNPGSDVDIFGEFVLAAHGTVLVGAPGSPPSGVQLPGRVYVYKESGNAWSLLQQLAEKDSGYGFGAALAVSGDRMLVGMPWYGSGQCGAAFEYVWSGDIWQQENRLPAPHCTVGGFGLDLALQGTTAVVGALQWRKSYNRLLFYQEDL